MIYTTLMWSTAILSLNTHHTIVYVPWSIVTSQWMPTLLWVPDLTSQWN